MVIKHDDSNLHVRYYLGINPYLLGVAGICACALLFLWKGYPAIYVEVGSAICVLLIVVRLFYNAWVTRLWLKTVVLSLVNDMS